jgi:hypothetical protein
MAFGGSAMSSVNSCKTYTYTVDVALLSETHLKPHERFFIPNYNFYRLTASRAKKAELPLQLEKVFPIPM